MSSRSEPDKWTVVGGGVEPDESGMTTSAREASEEVRREGKREGGRRWRDGGKEGGREGGRVGLNMEEEEG